MKKSLLTILAAGLLLLGLSSCGGNKKPAEKKIATVRIDTVQVADADAALQFPGKVVAAEDVNVSFKVAGTIQRILVKEGDHVAAGQLLAEMDAADYKVQLAAVEAEYANVKAEAERVMGLYADGATTASNNDKARYGLQQMEQKLAHARHQVEYCRIYAPFSGTVQHKYFEGRETVAAGMPVMSVIGGGVPEILVNLPAASYLNRQNFVAYSATFDVLPGQTIPLDFVSVLGKANTSQLYAMRLRLRDANADIAPGMSAWVTIHYGNAETGLVRIPTTSVIEDGGKSYAFVFDPKSHAVQRRMVSIQKLHTDGTADVMSDMQPGQLVVSSGAHFVKDGEKVNPLDRISSTNVGGLL